MNLDSDTLIGKLLRLPLRLIPGKTVLPVLSGPLRGWKWIAGSSVHGCWLGRYEHKKVKKFVASLRADTVVYDLGANAGYYSLVAARYCPKGRVYAFEPLSSNADHLRQHLAMNKISNVVVFEMGVSDLDGWGRFEPGMEDSMGRLSPQGKIRVRLITLDSLANAGMTPSPDIIKMDIEGAEYSALCGATSILTTKKPLLFLSIHGPEARTSCIRFLKNLGFSVMSWDGLPLECSYELIAEKSDEQGSYRL